MKAIPRCDSSDDASLGQHPGRRSDTKFTFIGSNEEAVSESGAKKIIVSDGSQSSGITKTRVFFVFVALCSVVLTPLL